MSSLLEPVVHQTKQWMSLHNPTFQMSEQNLCDASQQFQSLCDTVRVQFHEIIPHENLEQDRPFSTVHSLADMYGAFDRLHALTGAGGVIVPGHDTLVLERFAAVRGLEGIVVRV